MGMFITVEGLDGSGKTTVAERLADELERRGHEVVLTREPGGTPIGERIRTVLLGSSADAMRAETEALLFAAARAQHVAEVIQPALERGAVVICDRFVDSSLAYQWGGRGLDLDTLHDVQRLATAGLQPDLTVLLDVPVEAALRRRLADPGHLNRLDREVSEFHGRVRDAYHSLVAADPLRWRVIDADRELDDVWADVSDLVSSIDLVDARHSAGKAREKGEEGS
jgi:dTMP kinase